MEEVGEHNVMELSRTGFGFSVQAVNDTLQSPANRHTWDTSETPFCPQYTGRGSLKYLLSGCSKALTDRYYYWHHDQEVEDVARVFGAGRKLSPFYPGNTV